MKKFYTRIATIIAASIFIFSNSAAFSQNAKGFALAQQNEQFTTVSFDNPNYTQQSVQVNGVPMSVINTAEGVPNMNAGAPSVPSYTQSIVIPNEGHTTLEITYSNYTEIQDVDIAPSKGNLYRNINPSEVPYEFGAEYMVNDFYPGTLAEIKDPFILRDYRGQTIVTYPFQYNPVTKTLRVYEDINVTVHTDANQVGLNELTTTGTHTTTFDQVYTHQFLNYTALPQPKYTAVDEEGSCLVIGAASYATQMDELVEWKNRLGIPCEWVDIASIGNNDTDIKSYIENYYSSNPDLVFVILVGDHAQVNSHTYGSSGWGEQKWSDSYYAQMTGDFYPELFVGRLSGSTSEVQTMIDRQIEYEMEPTSGDHWSTAIGIGSDEGAGIGDDGEADWQHLRNIRTELIDFGFTTVYEFYDGSHGGEDASGNPSASNVQAAVNAGATLFNYTGHGAQNVCVTSNYGTSQINSATNNGMYPFVISVACNNGTFTSGTCLTEDFIRASNGNGPTGAIAACGSSILMSWAPPMETQDEMSKIITEQYAGNHKVSLGGLFYNSMMSTVEQYGSGGEEVMQTWVMFGDPAVMFRTEDPRAMNVSHYSWVELGESQLNVNCDIDDADITVTQAGEIIGTGVSTGGSVMITFNNALTTDDYLVVTAQKYNYDAYVGSVQVGSGTAGIEENSLTELSLYPNPANENTFVSFNLNESTDVVVTLTDMSGKVIRTITNAELSAGAQQFEVSTSGIESGVYFINVAANDKITNKKLTVIK